MDSDSEDEAPASEIQYSEEEEPELKKSKRKPPARGTIEASPAKESKAKSSQAKASQAKESQPQNTQAKKGKKNDPIYTKFQKAFNEDTLNDFKVADLKEFLESQSLPANGKKAFLVDVVQNFFDQ